MPSTYGSSRRAIVARVPANAARGQWLASGAYARRDRVIKPRGDVGSERRRRGGAGVRGGRSIVAAGAAGDGARAAAAGGVAATRAPERDELRGLRAGDAAQTR